MRKPRRGPCIHRLVVCIANGRGSRTSCKRVATSRPSSSCQAVSGPQLTEEEAHSRFRLAAMGSIPAFGEKRKYLGRLYRLHAAAAVYDAGEPATTRIEVDAVARCIDLSGARGQDLCAPGLGNDSIRAEELQVCRGRLEARARHFLRFRIRLACGKKRSRCQHARLNWTSSHFTRRQIPTLRSRRSDSLQLPALTRPAPVTGLFRVTRPCRARPPASAR